MAKNPILTVGYGSNGIETFVSLLKQLGVRYVLDVRSKPFSRYKPDFNRNSIRRALHEEHIRYVFMGDMLGGIPDDRSCYTDGRVDYEKVRGTTFHQEGIKRLRTAWEKNVSVALMCACGKPERCHRSKLIGISLQREGIPVVHVDDKGNEYAQQEVMIRLNGSPDLFGHVQEAAASRKKYAYRDE